MSGEEKKQPRIKAHTSSWSFTGAAAGVAIWRCGICHVTTSTSAGETPKPEQHGATY